MESSVKRIPVEVWHKILFYATKSPLLPFAEDGKLSSTLIDNIDLFGTKCDTLRQYRDETQATIGRLRLVCHTWSSLLQARSCEFAFTDFQRYHFPSKWLAENAIRVNHIMFFSCECCPEDRQTCVYAQIQKQIKHITYSGPPINELPASLFGKMKILLWHPLSLPLTELFSEPLVNLVALSLRNHLLPGHKSWEHMCSLLPNLSHLHFDVSVYNEHLFTKHITFPRIRYLLLRILSQIPSEPLYLARLAFPSLQSLRILGWLSVIHESHLLSFISRHGNSLMELDMASFSYKESESGDFLVRTSSTLWDTCSKIVTLGVSMDGLPFSGMNEPWHPKSSQSSPMTLLMSGLSPNQESIVSLIPTLNRLWTVLNLEKAVFTGSWRDKRLQLLDDGSWDHTYLNSRAKVSLEMLRRMDLNIVDRFEVPLEDIVQEMLSSL
jgi:hypothetical protein